MTQKILILSVPRSYTKALQQHIRVSLGINQQKIYKDTGFVACEDLGEVAHFNECTTIGYAKNGQRVPTGAGAADTFFAPEYIDGKLQMVQCEKKTKVECSDVMRVLASIVENPLPCVLKFFPSKMITPQWMFTEAEQDRVMNFLLENFTHIVPVLRLDNRARVASAVDAAAKGWDNPKAYGTRRTPTTEDWIKWNHYETYFRSVCVRYGLRPIWSEDLVSKGAKEVLAPFGLDVGELLPELLEYSSTTTLAEEEVDTQFKKEQCDYMPAAFRERLMKDPLYADILKLKRKAIRNAVGFVKFDEERKPVWKTNGDFLRWTAQGNPGYYYNRLLAIRELAIVNAKTSEN